MHEGQFPFIVTFVEQPSGEVRPLATDGSLVREASQDDEVGERYFSWLEANGSRSDCV